MLLPIIVAMLLYLGLTAMFAVRYDPQFWINDAVAAGIFAVLLLIALFADRHETRRR